MSNYIPKDTGMKAEPSERLSARIYRQIYVTKHAKERLSHIASQLAERRLNVNVFAEMCEVSVKDVGMFMTGTKTPTLFEYLRMASVLEWDISHDVNNLYMFEGKVHQRMPGRVANLIEYMIRSFDLTPYEMERLNEYHRMAQKPDNYSCSDWSEMALWVMGKEREYNLASPLELEE